MGNIITDRTKIDEMLTRGVHDLITKEELTKLLTGGKQLHLKLGIDVTGPQLHLGHTVVQRKIRDFQELGHRVTLIIGDFTTLVGDHSDKVDMRKETSAAQIKKDEETYKEQFFKTVIEEQTEIKHNSDWLKDLNFNDIIGLAKQFTISQMMDRETFKMRFDAKNPIGLDEFLYPLMQGYDSIALNCDIEFGGTDQTFNLLAGRKLMGSAGQTPQTAFITKLLTGSDGRPMGKSLKNFIPVTGNAEDMYGMIMSIVDEVIGEYFELVTRVPMNEVHEMETAMKNGENPMTFKKILAKEVVTFYHGKEKARTAQEYFEKTVQRGEVPIDSVDVRVGGATTALGLSAMISPSLSASERKRVIFQGGFEYNGIKVTDPNAKIEAKSGDTIKLGKRGFGRVQ